MGLDKIGTKRQEKINKKGSNWDGKANNWVYSGDLPFLVHFYDFFRNKILQNMEEDVTNKQLKKTGLKMKKNL